MMRVEGGDDGQNKKKDDQSEKKKENEFGYGRDKVLFHPTKWVHVCSCESVFVVREEKRQVCMR